MSLKGGNGISFTDLTVENNIVSEGVFSVHMAKLDITTAKFLNNHGTVSSNGIVLIKSDINLSKGTFDTTTAPPDS